MGTHEECIKTYPRVVRWNFPAILSHRSGLDKSIFRSMRPLTDKGLAFKAVEEWLLELHSLRYFDDSLNYQAVLFNRKGTGFLQTKESEAMLSDFDDKDGYNGAVPTARYLKAMHKKFYDAIRPFP